MAIFKCRVKGISPLGYSKPILSPQKEGENYVDYEERTWMERAHVDPDGGMFLPAVAWKLMMDEAARRYSMKIPGQQRRTYAKEFECGIFVAKNTPIGVNIDEIEKLSLFVPSDGKRGGSSKAGKVWKHFPVVQSWQCDIEFHILNPKITEKVFLKHLRYAALFVGMGMSRPQNRGYYGRFEVLSHEWIREAMDEHILEDAIVEEEKKPRKSKSAKLEEVETS